MTEEEITRMQMHSSAGGRHAALKEVTELLRAKAGNAFAAGRDEEARVVRRLADEMEVLRQAASSKLKEFVKERFGV